MREFGNFGEATGQRWVLLLAYHGDRTNRLERPLRPLTTQECACVLRGPSVRRMPVAVTYAWMLA